MNSDATLMEAYRRKKAFTMPNQGHGKSGVQNSGAEMRGTSPEQRANVQNAARPVHTPRPVVSGLGHAGWV